MADQIAAQIQKYSGDGVLVSTIGDGLVDRPHGVGVDSQGNIIVADRNGGEIFKFDAAGNLVAQWGGHGSEDGQFTLRFGPFQIAIDEADNYYILDPPGFRAVKFDSDGNFIANIGSEGTGPGQFDGGGPLGITVVGDELFMVQFGRDQIEVFDLDGNFVRQIADSSGGLNSLTLMEGLGRDPQGNLLVSYNGRVTKIDPIGNELFSFGTRDTDASVGPGEMAAARQAAAGPDGTMYVVDLYGVVRWGPSGEFLARWGSAGERPGQFASPDSIAISGLGELYIAEQANRRVQVFDEDGIFLRSFQPLRPADTFPGIFGDMAVASDGSAVILFSGVNDDFVVRRFSGTGQFLNQWGTQPTDLTGVGVNGIFESASSIAVDSNDLVYVGDSRDNRIQVFQLDGTYVRSIGSGTGSEEGQFLSIDSLAVAPDDTILAADRDRIVRFSSTGQFLAQYDKTIQNAFGMAVDAAGRIYVGDAFIEVYESNGTLLGTMAAEGVLPGQVNTARSIAIGPNQRVYALERSNNRVQRFRPAAAPGNTKAIVVTGGGPYPGNALWDATQVNANFAFRTLVAQGFEKDTIQYLSADINLDLDQNGLFDDVDADATNAAFESALTGDFAADADNLLIYMVDHGGEDTFRMSGSEVLRSETLDSWISTWQAGHPGGEVTIVYDACESGSFMDELSGLDRLVITSSSPGESAYFVSGGTMSFSNLFWTQVFNGEDVGEAFSIARDGTVNSFPTQNALLDANGNGVTNETADFQLAAGSIIGRGTLSGLDRPVLGVVSAPPVIGSGSTAEITVSNVFDSNGIARVWVVVRPPGFQPGSSDNPIAELPILEMEPVDDVGTYGVTSSIFTSAGTYDIAVFAEDNDGNVGVPQLAAITVNDPTRRRAVVVVGSQQDGSRNRSFERNGSLASAALQQQGYGPDRTTCQSSTCDDIQYLSSVTSFGTDGLTTLAALQDALTVWGTDDVTDLTLYLVGTQQADEFVLNEMETLPVAMLEGWLDQVQVANDGQLTIIYDGDGAGAFLPTLASNTSNPRIVLTSADADEQAVFRRSGRLSYSQFFWRSILNGAPVRTAHFLARRAIQFSAGSVTPLIEDQGNSVPNEIFDGIVARFYSVGRGILLAGDEPVVGSISLPIQAVADFESITASGVTSTGTIEEVFAVITRPDGQTIVESLLGQAPDYEVSSVGLCAGSGTYEVSVYAADTDGAVSQPVSAISTRAAPCADTSFDLAVTSVEAPRFVPLSDGSTSITINATNIGPATVASAVVTAYVSTNGVIDTSDTPIGMVMLSDVFSLKENPFDFEVLLPSRESTVYVGACVSVVDGEANAGNNCSTGRAVRVVSEDFIFGTGFED